MINNLLHQMFMRPAQSLLSKLNVLVTGGAGFIGSHLCRELLKEGAYITVLDDLSTGKLSNLTPEIKFILGSVNDGPLLEELIKDTNVIFHLAAIASVPKCEENPQLNTLVNFESTSTILNIAKKYKNVKSFVFTSSAAVYGAPKKIPITEDHDILPLSLYGGAKAKSEELLMNDNSLPTCCLRLFNIYGKGQESSSPYSGVLSIFVRNIITEQNISIFGDGKQTRDFTHVYDAVKAFIGVSKNLLESGTDSKCNNKSFNVCTEKGVDLNQIIKIFESITKKNLTVHYFPARGNDITHSIGNFTRINSAIGWIPEINLKDGLKMLINNDDF